MTLEEFLWQAAMTPCRMSAMPVCLSVGLLLPGAPSRAVQTILPAHWTSNAAHISFVADDTVVVFRPSRRVGCRKLWGGDSLHGLHGAFMLSILLMVPIRLLFLCKPLQLRHYLWRAVDQDGNTLDNLVQCRGNGTLPTTSRADRPPGGHSHGRHPEGVMPRLHRAAPGPLSCRHMPAAP
jgi:hypothetical protein